MYQIEGDPVGKNLVLRGEPRAEAQSLASEILGDLGEASGPLRAPSIFSKVKYNFDFLLLLIQCSCLGEADIGVP